MKVKFFQDQDFDGILIVEHEPQNRILDVGGVFRKIALPYLSFTFRYVKCSDNKFLYPGAYGAGLHVYGSLEPLSSFDQGGLFTLPFEASFAGLSCTSHDYDGYKYETLKDLVKDVSSIWYNSKHLWHQSVNLNDISSFKTLKNIKYIHRNSLKRFLETPKTMVCCPELTKRFVFDKNSELVSQEWDETKFSFSERKCKIPCHCGNCLNYKKLTYGY